MEEDVESIEDLISKIRDFAGRQKTHWQAVCKEGADHEDVKIEWWRPWFRGEENIDWPSALQPKLYRYHRSDHVGDAVNVEEDVKDALLHEQEMRVEFRRRASVLITDQQPVDQWQWYFLMQHYGAPTRLLD